MNERRLTQSKTHTHEHTNVFINQKVKYNNTLQQKKATHN